MKMTNQNFLDTMDELKNDVIDHLRQLIRDIDYMDIDSVEQIALSLGVIEKPIRHIEISNKYYTDDISHYFPEGTPESILFEALQNIEEPLQARSSHDNMETILCLKEEMYEALLDEIVSTLKDKFEYSFVEKVLFTTDPNNFRFLVSVLNSAQEGKLLLIKHRTGSTYDVFNIIDELSDDEVKEKIEDLSIFDGNYTFLATIDLEK
jgi:hypothetical protein